MRFKSQHTYSHYRPFGMRLSDRSSNSSLYRYGFNGMEKDDEVKGEGNSYTTEFRQYDPRIGRWKSIDPMFMTFPWQSPYTAFDNNPIRFNDPKGLASGDPVKDNDADGDIGTTAPNEGTRTGQGGVTGGDPICIGCGDDGGDIYGLPGDAGNNVTREYPFDLRVTAKFEFGVELDVNNSALGGITLNHSSTDLVGLDENKFHVGGHDLSEEGSSRTVNREFSLNMGGFGGGVKATYDGGYNGTLIELQKSGQFFGIFTVDYTFDQINNTKTTELNVGYFWSFGFMLVPEAGISTTLYRKIEPIKDDNN